jgi:hypothetical protein
MTSRTSAVAPILAALVLLAVPLGAYVGGYFWLGVLVDPASSVPAVSRTKPDLYRLYRYQWLASGFKPAARIESWLLDGQVQSIDPGRMGGEFYRETFHAPKPILP